MSELRVRRVMTGTDPTGSPVISDDGRPPNTVVHGPFAVSEVLWSDGPTLRFDDDPDRSTPGFPLEPPPGGVSVRVIRMPGAAPTTRPDDTWLRVENDEEELPGMHRTDTLDLMVVLEGSVVLGLDDGQRTLRAGECVVQRGTRHRWRPADEHGWTYLVAMLRPAPGLPAAPLPSPLIRPPRKGDRPVRRVVTGTPTLDGPARVGVTGARTSLTDLWQTGGPLCRPDQGGDRCDEWDLDPVGGGVAFRLAELSSAVPPNERAWHATATVDVDVVLSGRVRLELRGSSTELGPGDVVVQRGTEHRWVAVGDEPARVAAVMLTAQCPS